MTTITVYPTSASSGGTNPPFKGWTNIGRVTSHDNKLAECHYIGGRNGSYPQPALITCKGFKFNIQDSVRIKKITVEYSDYRGEWKNTNSWVKLSAPTVRLLGTSLSKKGAVPSTTWLGHSVVFDNLNLTGKDLKSKGFGVSIQYPKNSSTNVGNLFVDYIRLVVEYDKPVYVLSNGLAEDGTYNNPIEEATLGDYVVNKVYFRNRDGIPDVPQKIKLKDDDGLKLVLVECSSGSFDYSTMTWTVNPPTNTLYPNNVVKMKCVYACTKIGDYQATATHNTAGTVHFKVEVNDYPFPDFPDEGQEVDDDRIVLKYTNSEQGQEFPVQIIIKNPRKFKSKHCEYTFKSDIKPPLADAVQYLILDDDHSYNVNSCYIEGDKLKFELDRDDTGFIAVIDSAFIFDDEEGTYTFTCKDELNTEYLYVFDHFDKRGWIINCGHEQLDILTPNVVTPAGDGGYVIRCKSNNYTNYFEVITDSFKGKLEGQYRHIGNLILPNSHHDPKYNFKNTLTESSYKNRKYMGKKGNWDESLTLDITLPRYMWTSLKGFAEMDKPVWIDTAPSCSSDDLLNHRGWGVISEVSDLERINSWHYAGSLQVDYLTHDYYPLMGIELGNRVCNIDVPYNPIKMADVGMDISNGLFYKSGTGNFVYDDDSLYHNHIKCATGQKVTFTSKWTLPNYCDYTFKWSSQLPVGENAYQYNTIQFNVLDAKTSNILLKYLLYDFEYYNEDGEVVNNCKVSCVKYEDGNSYSLYDDTVILDFINKGTSMYGGNVQFVFNNGILEINDYDSSNYNMSLKDIELPSTEYLLQVEFRNNDVGLIEPDFESTLDVIVYESSNNNQYGNYYKNLMVSPYMLPNYQMVFYRETEKGLLYYYAGTENTPYYYADPFNQYKGGVNLETQNGVSIITSDTSSNPLYINNGLVKIGFDRKFGIARIYKYDDKRDYWEYIQTLKLNNFDEFTINNISDDFISIQFGRTIWSMWRGRPFVQIEHQYDDLVIVDDYDHITCEELIGADGVVNHTGYMGNVYLNRINTNVKVSLPKTTFYVDEPIPLNACVFDSKNHLLGHNGNGESYGIVNWITDDYTIASTGSPNQTWRDLNKLVNGSEDTFIQLTKSYVYNELKDKQFLDGIVISRNVTIDGDNHYLDCNALAKLFNVNKGATLTLKNCNLMNGVDGELTGVYYGNVKGKVVLESCDIETDNHEVIMNYNGIINADDSVSDGALLKAERKVVNNG